MVPYIDRRTAVEMFFAKHLPAVLYLCVLLFMRRFTPISVLLVCISSYYTCLLRHAFIQKLIWLHGSMIQLFRDPLASYRPEQVHFTVTALWQGCSWMSFLKQILLFTSSFYLHKRQKRTACYETGNTLHIPQIIRFGNDIQLRLLDLRDK
jgi:hypothetical protein